MVKNSVYHDIRSWWVYRLEKVKKAFSAPMFTSMAIAAGKWSEFGEHPPQAFHELPLYCQEMIEGASALSAQVIISFLEDINGKAITVSK